MHFSTESFSLNLGFLINKIVKELIRECNTLKIIEKLFYIFLGDVVQNLLNFHNRLLDFNNLHKINVASSREQFRSAVTKWHLYHKLLLVSVNSS